MNENGYFSRQNWLPTPGNILLVSLMGVLLFFVLHQDPVSGIGNTPVTLSSSINTISYQGQLTDPSGQPVSNGNYNFTFRLYNLASGGTALWTESWTGANAVTVTDGLFHVLLGNLTPIPSSVFASNATLWLGIQVGSDGEMVPRIQLSSVPFALQALTVVDGAITTNKLADGAVTSQKLSLENETVCLTAPVDIPIPTEWQVVPIPGMSISFSLPAESQVLLWASGNYHFNAPNYHIGTALFLDNSELVRASEYTPFTAWNDFSLVRLVSIAPGSHVLDLRTFAQTVGTVTYGGSGLETCFQFIVLN